MSQGITMTAAWVVVAKGSYRHFLIRRDGDGGVFIQSKALLDDAAIFPTRDEAVAVAESRNTGRLPIRVHEITVPERGPYCGTRSVFLRDLGIPVYRVNLPVPAPARRPTTGAEIWEWLRVVAAAQGQTAGTVISPDITVGELERLAGPGSFRKLAAWCNRKKFGHPLVMAKNNPHSSRTRGAGDVQPTDMVHVHYTFIG